MNTVGLIVNPKAGKDIRRIVSYGRFTTDEEKLNIVARILTGLTDSGVDRVLAMPDTIGLIKAAINKSNKTIELIEYYEKLKNLEVDNKEKKFTEKKTNKKVINIKRAYKKKRYYKKTK